MAWNKIGRAEEMNVIPLWLEPVAKVDDITEPIGANQSSFRSIALDDRVGGNGRTVDEEVDLLEELLQTTPFRCRQAPETFLHSLCGILGGRGFFPQRDLTPVVNQREIGE